MTDFSLPRDPVPRGKMSFVHKHGEWHTLDFLEHVIWLAVRGEIGLPPGRLEALAEEAQNRLEHFKNRYGDSRPGGLYRYGRKRGERGRR